MTRHRIISRAQLRPESNIVQTTGSLRTAHNDPFEPEALTASSPVKTKPNATCSRIFVLRTDKSEISRVKQSYKPSFHPWSRPSKFQQKKKRKKTALKATFKNIIFPSIASLYHGRVCFSYAVYCSFSFDFRSSSHVKSFKTESGEVTDNTQNAKWINKNPELP